MDETVSVINTELDYGLAYDGSFNVQNGKVFCRKKDRLRESAENQDPSCRLKHGDSTGKNTQ